MSRKLVASGVLALTLMLPAVSALAGSWAFTLGGGLSMPTGDFGDEDELGAGSGFVVDGALEYRVNDMFAVGLDASWLRNAHASEGESVDLGGGTTYTLDEDKFTTWQVGVHGKYFLPLGGNLSPYLLGGVGIYDTKEEWEETFTTGGVSTIGSGVAETDTRFGGKLGLGGVFKVNEMIGIGVEGNYNFITQDEEEVGVESLQYLGVTGGIVFTLPR